MIEQVKKQCSKLRLIGIMEHLEHRTSSALESQIHPLDYLRLLLEDETLYRKNARAKRLISRAKFRHDCDLEDWDDSFDRGISKAKMKDLAKLNPSS